mgnify:CR=1 FL=1
MSNWIAAYIRGFGGATVAGVGYGFASVCGLGTSIDKASDNWGRKLLYGDEKKSR